MMNHLSQKQALNDIYNKAKELERKSQLLKARYDNDGKYARSLKRQMEKDPLTDSVSKLFGALKGLKTEVDKQIEQNAEMLDNENFVEKMVNRLVTEQFKTKQKMPLTLSSISSLASVLSVSSTRDLTSTPPSLNT
ncbi:MAG: type I restriction enzyme R subunit [Gammaproteobacteria bacterium]|jgi:type I restriction enzyme R subunit